jgi:hypothetical protein
MNDHYTNNDGDDTNHDDHDKNNGKDNNKCKC